MSTQENKDHLDWHAVDDTDSDDDSDSSTESEDSHGNHEEEEKKVDEQLKAHYQPKESQGGYKHNRDGGYKPRNNNFNEGNPNSNYNLYYRNDPDFFVKVIKQVEPPHEL